MTSKNNATDEDEDYMELFVAKELKDKITPIEETLKERKEEIDKIFNAVETLATENKTIDKHYN